MVMKRIKDYFLFLALWSCCCSADYGGFEEHLIQTLEEKIDAENFTYYRLLREGNLRIELNSLKGDVDIYGSSKTQHPSYFEYEMKSDTCGIDTVSVPEDMARPVYIAIYGHPSYLHSKFRLNIYFVKKPKVESYEDLVAKYENYYFDNDGQLKQKEVHQGKSESKKPNAHIEDDQPLWVKILLGILEFGIDVII